MIDDISKDVSVSSSHSSKDLLMLVIYISWVFLINILFAVVNKFVIPSMIAKGLSARISLLMSMFDLIISGIDVLFLILIFSLAKSNFVKWSFIVFLIVRVALFTLNKVNV